MTPPDEGTVWTAPAIERTEADLTGPERQQLEAWLDFERATLQVKCSGLTAEQLRTRAVPPSNLSLLGLVRHMVDVERQWFRQVAGGEDVTFDFFDLDGPDPDLDFNGVAESDAEADLAALRREIALCRAAVADLDLDLEMPLPRPGNTAYFSLRWIYIHMIEEYARHNGHADLLRELLDGSTGH
jgi:uncharacterized damage-inducible protein DinB